MSRPMPRARPRTTMQASWPRQSGSSSYFDSYAHVPSELYVDLTEDATPDHVIHRGVRAGLNVRCVHRRLLVENIVHAETERCVLEDIPGSADIPVRNRTDSGERRLARILRRRAVVHLV